MRTLEQVDAFFDYQLLARTAQRLRTQVRNAEFEARLDKVIAAALAIATLSSSSR